MNKGLIIGIIVVAAILVIGGWWWMIYGANNQNGSNLPANDADNNQSAAQGSLYVGLTDAAVNMETISSIDMTIDKIYVHSQGQGWITLSTTPQTFDLLELKSENKNALLVKADVKADTYDQVWFHVAKVMVTEKGKAAVAAKVPSGDFKMQGTVKVVASSTSTALIDVLADQSMHKTGKGEFIFAPVVKFEGRSNATVNMTSGNMVEITSGTVDSNTSAGMDVNGEVKANFKIETGTDLQINGGVINVKGAI